MAKGAVAKGIVTNKILKTFPGSFLNGKEIRIPMEESGEIIQIKFSLVCAKDNIANPNQEVIHYEDNFEDAVNQPQEEIEYSPELTEEEKEKVSDLVERLGLAQ